MAAITFDGISKVHPDGTRAGRSMASQPAIAGPAGRGMLVVARRGAVTGVVTGGASDG